MSPTHKALWFIESQLGTDLTLDRIAASSGVSRFHLVRAFAAATGVSVMRYVRARRLSVAAMTLTEEAADILGVALEAGYGSHEAFTRAFRDQFGATPETVRSRRVIDRNQLQEPIKMDTKPSAKLSPPRFETGRAFLVAGCGGRYTFETSAGIPGQWQRLQPHIGSLEGEVPGFTYGVVCNHDDSGNFD